MSRFTMAVVAAVGLLALALSAAPAGAATDAAPPAGTATSITGATLVKDRGAAAYDCPASAKACCYSGYNGGGERYVQYGCGFAGPGGSPINEYVFSVKNQSGGPASLYNWAGYGYQYKGHAAAYQTGNFWDNVGADVVNVFC